MPSTQKKFEGYYKIARHYKWALNQVFHQFKYDAVIIVEGTRPENRTRQFLVQYFHLDVKGTRCLGSDELVYKKHFVTVCYKRRMVGKIFF